MTLSYRVSSCLCLTRDRKCNRKKTVILLLEKKLKAHSFNLCHFMSLPMLAKLGSVVIIFPVEAL